MPDVHSKYSPSSSDRWLACPASLQFESEDRASEYAAQGTVAHSVVEQALLFGTDPFSLVGEVRQADGYDITIDEEMANGVLQFVDFVNSLEGEVFVEGRIESEIWDGFGGTLDVFVKRPDGRLHVIDFKYGAGVAVEVYENPQLSCYAILAAEKTDPGTLCDTMLTIIQPRATHHDGPIRSWEASAKYLSEFYEKLQAVFVGDRQEFAAGDHCRWCPHKAQCPELYALTVKTAQEEFNEPGMTPERAAEVLKSAKAITDYLESVHEWIHGQLDKGVSIPGYKLVQAFSNREWAFDAAVIERKCKSKGFGKKDLYVSELRSPAQLEKIVGKDLVASLVERKLKGTTVVPESDSRPAVVRQSAAEEFSVLGDEHVEC